MDGNAWEAQELLNHNPGMHLPGIAQLLADDLKARSSIFSFSMDAILSADRNPLEPPNGPVTFTNSDSRPLCSHEP